MYNLCYHSIASTLNMYYNREDAFFLSIFELRTP
nr:MAG TPA: hypothetical protein [Caudoviricetes sp.]